MTFSNLAASAPVAADEYLGSSVVLADSSLGIELHAVFSRQGRVVARSNGTDVGTVQYLADLLSARLEGLPEPELVEPTGEVEFLPGLGGGEPSGEPGGVDPAVIRTVLASVPDLNDDVTGWLETHPDEDILAIVNDSCAALAAMDDDANLQVELISVFGQTEDRVKEGLTPEGFGNILGAGVGLYCLEDAQRVGLL